MMIHRIAKKLIGTDSQSNDQILRDIAYTTNLVKNGMTVKTGEYEALSRIFTGQKMYVDTRDISVAPHIMLEGEWETNLVRVVREQVKPESVVFDIGANFGFYGIVLSTNNPLGNTHLFEANPELIPYIKKSLAVNGLTQRANIVNCAVTDTSDGTSNINVYNDYWGSSTVHDIAKENIYKTHAVQNITIDSYCDAEGIEKVDIIKIDIEGFEDKAFNGMKKTLKKNPQLQMFMEFTSSSYENPKAFYNDIRRYFDIVQIIEESTGDRTDVGSYSDLEKYSQDWVMLYLSNN